MASLRNNNDVNGGGQSQQPIVIHSHAAPSLRNGSWTAIIIQVGVGAGACWTAYFLFSNFLPEQLKEMMPVTRKFFQTAVTSLGNGIIKVRDALSEQIAVISGVSGLLLWCYTHTIYDIISPTKFFILSSPQPSETG